MILPYCLVFLTWMLAMYCHLTASLLFIPRRHLRRYAAAPRSAIHKVALAFFYLIPAVWLFSPSIPTRANLCHGLFFFAVGSWWAIWAQASNPYFVPYVAAPPEIIRKGAYKWLNHPAYTGWMAMSLGAVMILGQWWGLMPMALYWSILLLRMHEETELIDSMNDK